MKKIVATLLALACANGASAAFAAAASQAAAPSAQEELRPSPTAIEQWRDRKFGMFIHFGLYSVAGGMWKGRKIDNGYSEQILANAPLPPQDYAALAQTFDPERFDPDAIVALAKAAGMKYIVITAKHHDGFNLFGTKVTNYNIVDATPYRRDLIKALAEACKRGGIAFGVYYSTIDWHHPGGNRYIEGNSNPITPAQEAFNVAQLKELLSNYGPISEIWFDMGKPTPQQSRHFERTVHRLQPDTMVSGRVWNHQGDFTVMGDNAEPSVAVEEPWESPASMYPDTWGYRSWQVRDDLAGKVHEHIARLVHVVSAGGNYILNIGPEGDGSVVPFEADVLAGVGAWLKTNGQAIYGTRAQPFKALDFGYATLGRQTLYLFVEKPPADGRLRLPGVVDSRLGNATVLGAPGVSLPVSMDADGAVVDISRAAELGGGFMPVIAIPFEGALHVRPKAVAPDGQGAVRLVASNGETFLRHDGYGYADPPTIYKMRWDVGLGPGQYVAAINYKPVAKPRSVELVVDGHAYPLQVGSSGHASVQVRRDPAASPYAMRLEIVPPSPIGRADRLPVAVRGVEVRPR
jgi:alpha-L-fucosidase